MKTFKDFITEDSDIKQEVHELPHGGRVYSQRVNSHLVQTHFYPRVMGNEEGHYDIHFIRKTDGSGADAFSRRGIGKMSIEERLKAIHSVKKAAQHFIDDKEPKSLTAMANTDKKADWAEEMMRRMTRSSKAVVRNGNEVTLNLKKD